MIKLRLYILLSVLYCFAAITHALPNAKPDAEQPVTISSDNAVFNSKLGVAEYQGHVIVDQGSRHLEASTLTIQRDTNNQIEVIIANGTPATFKSQANPRRAIGYGKAKTIKYYPQKDHVDLFENAELTQNGDTVSGPKLSYNFVTEILQGKSSTKQRTTVILRPKRAS